MSEKTTVPLQVRLTAGEKEAFQTAADLRGLNLSTWIRTHLRKCATDELTVANVTPAFAPAGIPGSKRLSDEELALRKMGPSGGVVPVVLTVSGDLSPAPRLGTKIAAVLEEDPTKPAVVPAGGTIDADGKIWTKDRRFVGTAKFPASGVVQTPDNDVPRETKDLDDVVLETVAKAAGVELKPRETVSVGGADEEFLAGTQWSEEDREAMVIERPVVQVEGNVVTITESVTPADDDDWSVPVEPRVKEE